MTLSKCSSGRCSQAVVFTGIISDICEVTAVKRGEGDLLRLTIACGYDPATVEIGASIACNGVCLTAVARCIAFSRRLSAADARSATLRATPVGGWKGGTTMTSVCASNAGDEL